MVRAQESGPTVSQPQGPGGSPGLLDWLLGVVLLLPVYAYVDWLLDGNRNVGQAISTLLIGAGVYAITVLVIVMLKVMAEIGRR